MIPRSFVTSFAKLLSTAATDTSFPSRVATITDPSSNAGYVSVAGAGATPNAVILRPFGAGADNTTFDMRLTVWDKIGTFWVPQVLWQGSCTLSAAVGVASQTVTNTDRFADTIDTDIGTDGVTCSRISPANDTAAEVLVDLRGRSNFEVTFDMTSATNGNCLYSPVSP